MWYINPSRYTLILLFFLSLNSHVYAEVGHGLLWRVHKAKTPASYLFGTIHIDDKRVKNLSRQVKRRFDEAKTLCLEILPDRETQVGVGLAMLLPESVTLDALIGDPIFSRLSLALNRKGISPMQAIRLKPWAAMVMLSRPESKGGYALDEQLYHWANYQYKSLCALETIEEQLAIFDQLSLTDQIDLLNETLRHLPELSAMNEELIQSYLGGDLNGIYEKSLELNQVENKAIGELLRRKLIDDRNHRMVQRMEPYLSQGRAFIAVGALHLPGEQGLIKLLQKQGYLVSPPSLTVSPW